MTVLEKEYMTRMPNEIRRLRESIDKLAEILKPISDACKNHPECNIDPEAITDSLEKIGKTILKQE